MIKLKNPPPKEDFFKPKAGLCDKCNKRIKYLYNTTVQIEPCWYIKCSCGHINICN